jgi:hypothetical protein
VVEVVVLMLEIVQILELMVLQVVLVEVDGMVVGPQLAVQELLVKVIMAELAQEMAQLIHIPAAVAAALVQLDLMVLELMDMVVQDHLLR